MRAMRTEWTVRFMFKSEATLVKSISVDVVNYLAV